MIGRRLWVGLDPGADGAVAVLDGPARLVIDAVQARHWRAAPVARGASEAERMRAALEATRLAGQMVERWRVTSDDVVRLIVEAPQTRAGQAGGVVQAWRASAQATGLLLALSSLTSAEVEVVEAATWTRAMDLHGQRATPVERKAARVARVMALCPGAERLLVQPGSKVAHDGTADAVLLALYGAGWGRDGR